MSDSIKVESTSEPDPAPPAPDEDKAKPVEAHEEEAESAPEADEASDENADDSESSETPESLEAAADDAEERPKKTSGFEKRIRKLNTKVNAHKQEAEYWRQEAMRLKAQESPNESKQAQPEAPKGDDGRPDPNQFESHAEYVEALADWKVERKLKEREAKDREAQLRQEFQRQVESHTKRVKAFAKEHDDFEDVLENVNHVRVSPTVEEVIINSENGPALMYELAKNKAEFERICALPAVAAARELGRIEARLIKQDEPEPKKKPEVKTKAPPPITPVGKKVSSMVKKSIFDPDLSQAEYERLRMEQRGSA